MTFPKDSVSVRGYTAYNRPAGPGARIGAVLFDLATLLLVFSLTNYAFRLAPTDLLVQVAVLVAEAGLYWAAQRLISRRTPGQALWQLKRDEGALLQHDHVGPLRQIGASFLTTTIWIAAAGALFAAFHLHPLLRPSGELELEAFSPPGPEHLGERWTIVPFFYSLGAWPTTFGGNPVFYGLPYEKGPPNRFVGHIIARWDAPDTKVIFEGPRSPEEQWPRQAIRDCFRRAGALDFRCAGIREATLIRHIRELEKRFPGRWAGGWRVEWYRVRNPSLPEAEWLEGIHVAASDGKHAQERFILITARGVHQAIILETPDGPTGGRARQLFLAAIASLRASDDLAPGRQWINDQLKRVRLEAIERDSAALAARISEIQAQLLGKISIDPRGFDAYYHLGGTAMILAKASRPEAHGESWTAVARPLLQSLQRYAQDIAPQDPRARRLQEMALELQKP